MGEMSSSFLIIAIILIAIWVIYRIIIIRKCEKTMVLREVTINIFFVYFLAVVYFTFFKCGELWLSFEIRRYANLIPFKETINMFKLNHMGMKIPFYNVMGNILLFVPFGFFIPLLFEKGNKISKVVLYGVRASFSIELLQYFTPRSIPDIDDIIFNAFGAFIGILCYRIFYALIKVLKLDRFIENIKTHKSLI